jgi:hypothetical protein
MQNSGKVSNYGWIIRDCCQRWKLFMLYLTDKSFSRQLQLLVKLRVKEVHLFHIFLTNTINR